jgi:hypothetical protein
LSGNEERLKALIENNPAGVPWTDIAEALGFTADPEKAKLEKVRRKVNAWVAKTYGTGGNKKVYSVYSSELGMKVYKHIQVMDRDELEQAGKIEDKNLDMAISRVKVIERRKVEIEILLRTRTLEISLPEVSSAGIGTSPPPM